jgi:hypothetical protein
MPQREPSMAQMYPPKGSWALVHVAPPKGAWALHMPPDSARTRPAVILQLLLLPLVLLVVPNLLAIFNRFVQEPSPVFAHALQGGYLLIRVLEFLACWWWWRLWFRAWPGLAMRVKNAAKRLTVRR